MTVRALVVTLMLTIVVVTIVGIMFEPGNGGVLFLAILGGAIVWLFPGSFAVALPAGAFGGVVLSHAEHPASEASDEDPKREIVRLAVAAFVLSVLIVGWILPMGSQEMNRPFARYQDGVQAGPA